MRLKRWQASRSGPSGSDTRFLIDEDLPRSLASELRTLGHNAEHVIDTDLRGRSDEEILRRCRSIDAVLVSGDLGFSNLLEFPLGSHPGIVVARLPNELSISSGNQILIAGILEALPDLRGSLLIVEPGQIRIRTVPKG